MNTDKKLVEMEKHLISIYSRAQKEVSAEMNKYLAEIGKEISDFETAYELAKKGGDEAEIRKTGKKLGQAKRERTIQSKRFKDLSEQMAVQLANVNKTALAYINGELPEIYASAYNELGDIVDGVGGGYSFTLTDTNTVKNLATKDKSLLPFKKLDLAKDIPWNMRKINGEVLQGILQGESMDKIAKRMRNVQEMNLNQAIRTARTTVTSAENKGRQDSYQQAEDDGIIIHKEWIATADNRTRHTHRELDGKTVPQDKPFVVDGMEIMFPADPEADPSLVYNCRCTLGAVVVGFKKKVKK